MLQPEDDFTATSHARIVERAKAGDDDAFNILAQHYCGPICGYLAGLVGDEEEAYDLTQETMLKAWQKLSTLHDVMQFKQWLYTIARNNAYDHLRRRQTHKKSVPWEDSETEDAAVNTSDPQEHTAEIEFLKSALAEIPEKYRDCLLLQTVGGFSQSEVAELVGIGKNSVSTYVSNARKLLREIYQRLGEKFPGETKGGQTNE
jgi:RNA polymerase sigma-70 factor (ECF subfamily)